MASKETVQWVIEHVNKNHCLKLFYGKDNPNNKIIHVRGVVDNDKVVFCYWLKHKQYWFYKVEDMYLFELWREEGHLTEIRGVAFQER